VWSILDDNTARLWPFYDPAHNIITVVMNEKAIDLDGAFDWVAEYHEQVLSEFQATECCPPGTYDPSEG
jgi:hypothetical protein